MNLPIGSIILWTSTNIPDGWQICNGSNGTPNLLYKFVKGASVDGEVGVEDGSASHGHSNGGTGAAGGHGHSAMSHNTADSGKAYFLGGTTGGTPAKPHNHGSVSITPDAVANHSHTVGFTNVDDTLPPHKEFIYIMRIM